jgi:uncharacterized cofD-like protein
VILGPGDLYTSIVPTLLVSGMTEAIKKSQAKFVYVTNLMTKRGETDNFKVEDFVETIHKYLGDASDKLGYVLVNKELNHSKKDVEAWYKKYGSKPVLYGGQKIAGIKVIEKNFMDNTTLFRHDPEKLAKTLSSLV